jgi:hypothetical protein
LSRACAGVFGRYLRGLSRREITQIHQIVELPPERLDARKERLERLQKLARREGLMGMITDAKK